MRDRRVELHGDSRPGKVKLLLDVIGDLRSLADSLQAVADAVADNGEQARERMKNINGI